MPPKEQKSKEQKAANLEKAFSLAEQHYGVPKMLDGEDMASFKPDEKSVMTYVATLRTSMARVSSRRSRASAGDDDDD